jgi:hypothetical protein
VLLVATSQELVVLDLFALGKLQRLQQLTLPDKYPFLSVVGGSLLLGGPDLRMYDLNRTLISAVQPSKEPATTEYDAEPIQASAVHSQPLPTHATFDLDPAAVAHAHSDVIPRGGDPLLFDPNDGSVLAGPSIDQSATVALRAPAFEPLHLAEREVGFKMMPMLDEGVGIAQHPTIRPPIKRSSRLQARMQQEHVSKQAPDVLTHHPGMEHLDPLPTNVYQVDQAQAGLQLALLVGKGYRTMCRGAHHLSIGWNKRPGQPKRYLARRLLTAW